MFRKEVLTQGAMDQNNVKAFSQNSLTLLPIPEILNQQV